MEATHRALNIQVNSSIKAFLRHMVHIFFRQSSSGYSYLDGINAQYVAQPSPPGSNGYYAQQGH
jgi:hypothetical protein